MKKTLVAIFGVATAVVLVLTAAAVMFAPGSGGSTERTQRDMSKAEQRKLLQSFFATPLPRELQSVKIRSDLPAMADGEVHASFRVLPEEAAALASGLRRLQNGGYRGPGFESADGMVHVDTDSGKIRIDWIEH